MIKINEWMIVKIKKKKEVIYDWLETFYTEMEKVQC